MSERIIFCAHSGVRIRPASHTEQPRRDAVRPSAPPTPAEILAAAAYSPPAAQTRTVSAALFRPNPRKLWRQFKWISFLTESGVRISYAQPASRSLRGGFGV